MAQGKGVEIVCTLNTPVTSKQAHVFEKALAQAFREAFPDEAMRACWVHERIEHPDEDEG